MPWFLYQWLRLAKHLTSLLDNVLSFPAHADDGSAAEERRKTTEEWFLGQVSVVGLGHFFGGPDHLQSDKLVPALFETGDDVTDQSTLNAIGLDSKEGALLVGSWLPPDWKAFLAAYRLVAVAVVVPRSDGHHQSTSHDEKRLGAVVGGRSCNSLRNEF